MQKNSKVHDNILFGAVDLRNIKEYSVETYYSIRFFSLDKKEIRRFYDNSRFEELRNLNQGYLLFTYGEK